MASNPADKFKNTEAAKPTVLAKPAAVAAVAATPAIAKPVAVKPVAAPKAVAPTPVVAKTATAPTPTKTIKAKPAVTPVSPKGNTMNETVTKIEAAAKNFTAQSGEKATAMLHDVTARAKTAMEKGTEMSKNVVAFNKDNLEAVVESGKIAVKGMQTAAQNAADYGRKNFEATSTMVKTAAAVKSPAELLKVQGEFAKSQFESAVAEMSKSSEFTLKLIGEIFQPISNRYSVAADMVKTRLAA